MTPRPHPPALPHGELREVLPGVFFVTGTVVLPTALPVRFGRNMTIVREGDRLVLVNAVRLDDAGLAALDALGKVTDVIRLAGNHGMDDPFYRERYGAKVWAVRGQRYTAGFDTNAKDVYFEPDVAMDETSQLPLAGARLVVLHGNPPEGLLLLERHGGTIVSGDCLQHWIEDERASFVGRVVLKLGGFTRPHNVGPAWLKQTKPPKDDLKKILDLDFANVLTAHGREVIGGARERYRAAIERVTSE